MLGMAAARLGAETIFLDPSESPPAATVGRVIREAFDSSTGLAQLAQAVDVISYEFENVPVAALQELTAGKPVYPPPEALRCAQDRLFEKTLFRQLDIPLPAFRPVSSREELDHAALSLGYPFVLKTRTLGYDGKGQAVVRNADEKNHAWNALGRSPLIAEQWVDFDFEVSVIGARNRHGECVVYPLTENRHHGGILRVSRAPCQEAKLVDAAHRYLVSLLEHFNYTGVLALELFVQGEKLLANEFAPRVHNSGHWTIEGAVTSQFENHVRAVLDLPFGDTSAREYSGMVNLIGTMPDISAFNADFPWFLHDYGKSARPGRKLGHITVLADSMAERDRHIASIEQLLAD